MKRTDGTPFIEGDIFKIGNDEYQLRLINKHLTCWLEPVLYRDNCNCVTGGKNKIYHMDELVNLEYLGLTYVNY